MKLTSFPQGIVAHGTGISSQRKSLSIGIETHCLDTQRTRLKGENDAVLGKADHKDNVKVRFQKEETRKTKCCATIKKCLWMLLLFGMLTIVHGNAPDPYPPPVRQHVEMGDAVKMTEVQSHGCRIKLTLFTGIEELPCRMRDLYSQETCTFENGRFKPDSPFNLEYREGCIWKTNITAPYSFCADNSCTYSVTSGQILLKTRNKSVSTTPATSSDTTTPATSSDTTTQHTLTTREATTNRNFVSPAWRRATIVLISLVSLVCLSHIIYCYKTWKRKAGQMNGRTEYSCCCLLFVCGSRDARQVDDKTSPNDSYHAADPLSPRKFVV